MLGWFKKKLGKKEEKVADKVAQNEVDLVAGAGPLVEEVAEEVVEIVSEEPVATVVEEGGGLSDEKALDEEIIDEEPLAEEAPVEGSPSVATQKEPAVASKDGKSLFGRLQEGLAKTRKGLVHQLDLVFLGKKEIDESLLEEVEEVMITADLGVNLTCELLDEARRQVKRNELADPMALKNFLKEQILGFIQQTEQPSEMVLPDTPPFVIMVIGVNGVGKTTTIGKVAKKFKDSGSSVLLVAGDTFRAAAVNQLKLWSERSGAGFFAGKDGADPSSVVFDGIAYGQANNFDVILIDTAGRLQTSVNLMEELRKVKRVIGKKYPGAPHEIMLVIDATTGQNGISQAKLFHEAVGVTGLALTKLDGTAKGGIVANVCREMGMPIRFIGVGEKMEDLRDFDAAEFVEALFAEPE